MRTEALARRAAVGVGVLAATALIADPLAAELRNACPKPTGAAMGCAGTNGDEALTTGDGDDVIVGFGGADRLNGKGGAGKDNIYSRDGGKKDTVKCGKGADIAKVDDADKVASDCETVAVVG